MSSQSMTDRAFTHHIPAVRDMMQGLYTLCWTHGFIPRDHSRFDWCQQRIGNHKGLSRIIEDRPGIMTEALNELLRRGVLIPNDEYSCYVIAATTDETL